MADEGIIIKALSGFYYVLSDDKITECRARGKFRYENIVPLVGDRVIFSQSSTTGTVEEILPRKNSFVRPAVSNVDQIVMIVSESIPVTDPYLIDKMISIAEIHDVEPVICINKCDLSSGETLYSIYRASGFSVVRTSATTGYGIDKLKELISGKVSVFTGNSGVGKSSLLNAVDPDMNIKTDVVSEKLGRGKHTTRHIEFYKTSCDAIVADTPGFSSFEFGDELKDASHLQYVFREFEPYLGKCQFTGCSHTKEKGCGVLKAVETGAIQKSRHNSYVRLYNELKDYREWMDKTKE